MNIVDLAILKKMVAGGGGSGTDNYNDLSNLPQINGETLAGNKTAENLGLQDALTFDSAPTEDSTNPVESGGVYNALAGKQDNLTFDDDPTENSTNPVKSGGVYSALAGKQDNLTFDGVYNASTNKAATESTVTNAIAGLDVSDLSVDADETISSISETDGKISVTKQDIAIASNQVVAMTGYTKPSSAPATPAIQQGDTVNQAIGKLEYKADTNQTNILSAEGMVANPFNTTTAYAVGDVVTYDHGLYKFTSAHSAGAWNSSQVTQIKVSNNYVPNSSLVEVVNDGAKNLLDFANLKFKQQGSTTYTKTDTYITTTSTGAWASTAYETELPAGTYVFSANISDLSIGSGGAAKIVLDSDAAGHGTRLATIAITQNGTINGEFTWSGGTLYIMYYPNYTSNVVTTTFTASNNMICTKSQFGISPEYEPYALGNQYLTPALIEQVDSGSKNALDISEGNLIYTRGVSSKSLTPTTGTVSMTSDGTTTWARIGYAVTLKAGVYIFSGNVTASATNGRIDLSTSNTGAYGSTFGYIETNVTGKFSKTFTLATDQTFYVFVYPNYSEGTAAATTTIASLMICSLADWNVSQKYVPYRPNWDLVSSVAPFYSVLINHNMIYRGQNLGTSLTDAHHTALSSGNFTDLFLGDYWTKTVTIPAGTYTGGDGEEVTVPAQTNITLKAVIADFDTFYAGYASSYAGINTHHAAVIVTGFSNVVWNKTNSTAGGYVASLIHKWLVGSALPQIETWFGSAKVLSHQKLLTNAITGDAASGWAWSSQKISLLSENQLYGSKVWGGSKATNGGYEPGEAFKHLNVFNHIDANLLFGNKNIWCRDIASAEWAACLVNYGSARHNDASATWIAPAALILLS